MPYSAEALSLRKPRTVELPRAGDRITFLALDRVRVRQGRTGVEAVWEREGGVVVTLPIPVATVNVLLLGPGSSVTTDALSSAHRAGCSLIVSDAAGVAGFAVARPLSSRAAWAAAQARVWADPQLRMQAARVLYGRMLPEGMVREGMSLQVLRGLEGRMVRSLYQRLAAREGLSGWRREADRQKCSDPVNPLLNLGNSVLYGVAAAACMALGVHTSLGFIHQGSAGALLYDLADVYKKSSTIPMAFRLAHADRREVLLRRRLRGWLVRERVLDGMLGLLDELLGGQVRSAASDVLFDGDGRTVPGMRNYAGDG